MDIKDIYWLAGILEGEGCFGLSSGSARISLNMTDKDVVDKAAKMLGGITKVRPKKENRKQVYSVEIFSTRAAEWMMTLYTLMGERRQETIESSLSFWKNQRFKNKNGLGRKNPRTKREREQNEAIIARHRNES